MSAAPYPLTPRQRDVLRFVCGYQLAHDGVSPSLNEIRAALGLEGRGSVLRLLRGLEERGWIVRLPNRSRAIRVIEPLPVPGWPGAPLYAVPLPALHAGVPA